jgi:glucose/arabinose dehydrogenase
MNRRRVLATLTGLTAGLAGCGFPTDGTTEQVETPVGTVDSRRPDTVGLDPVLSGLRAPLDIAFAPDADRRYVAEQQGVVHVHEDGLRSEPLLDLRGTVLAGGERGLLGFALHPEFADNRRVFVRYSAPLRSGMPSGYSHTFVLSEFRVTADGRRVRPDSERIVLEIAEPQANHNAGSIVFGSDGYLYVGVGDGGAGGDQGRGHVRDWYDRVDGGNGQDVTGNLLGSVLRIDVDGREDGKGYAIPDDNPLVGRAGYDEHYAWGFRNPWKLSVDGGRLYAGDVGQSDFEEIDRVETGGNYGWNVREGFHCYRTTNCPDSTPDDLRGGEPLRDPVVEYPHSGQSVSGVSVIIGNVYRGSTISGLDGAFVFGDYQAGGDLFLAERTDGRWPTAVLSIADEGASNLQRLLSVNRDADGELYALGTGASGGGVYRLVPS